MKSEQLTRKAESYLQTLCVKLPTRRTGTQGNRDATRFFKNALNGFGFKAESQLFDCIAMQQVDIMLASGDQEFEAFISPHSLGCDLTAELISLTSLLELEKAEVEGKILMLSGEIAREQLMPKGFVFYNPEDHQKIYRLLEEKQPAAVITATTKNPDAVGAIYPFPLIEDGDFDIPVAFMTAEEGIKLAKFAGQKVSLKMESVRIPSTGENIVARKGKSMDKKVVLCAHIDTKENTPGALDNASGIAILMLLAEQLQNYEGQLGVEIVALNGEEYYNTPGQNEYLKQSAGTNESILLAINLDDIGYYKDRTAFSLYEVPERTANLVRKTYDGRDGFFEGPAWYQSDHGIFIANGIPAMAITEESFAELLAEITHSEKDSPEIVDTGKLADNAIALHDLIIKINESDLL